MAKGRDATAIMTVSNSLEQAANTLVDTSRFSTVTKLVCGDPGCCAGLSRWMFDVFEKMLAEPVDIL